MPKKELVAELEELTAELEKVASEKEALKKEIEGLQEEKAKLEEKIVENESKNQELGKKNSELENQVNEIKKELVEARENQSNNKDVEEKKIVELTKKLNAAEEKRKEYADRVELITTTLQDTDNIRSALETENVCLKSELDHVNQILSQKTADFLQQEEELRGLREASGYAGKEYETLVENVANMKITVEKLTNQNAEKDAQIKSLEEELNAGDEKLKTANDRLQTMEAEFSRANKELNAQTSELSELREIVQQSMDVSLVKPANNLLGELGNSILSIYAKLNGENNPKIAQTFDIQEALHEIANTIESKMVKIEDLQLKDKALAIRIPNRREYLVMNNMLEYMLYIYTPPEDQQYKDIIVGEIESISNPRGAGPLGNIYKADAPVDAAMDTVFINVRELSNINFSSK